jgi:hypothetical protein
MESEKKKNSDGIRDVAMKLIRHINTWKKALIVMALVTFGASGYTVWENRTDLADWLVMAYGTPSIDESSIEPEIDKLLSDVGAQSATVWAVNLHQNKRTAIYFRIKDHRLKNIEGAGDLALRPYSDHSAAVIKTITDKALCVTQIANTAVGEAERKAGVTYVCLAAIPPAHGTMIGLLVVGFTSRPKHEDYIKLRMITAAQRIIK